MFEFLSFPRVVGKAWSVCSKPHFGEYVAYANGRIERAEAAARAKVRWVEVHENAGTWYASAGVNTREYTAETEDFWGTGSTRDVALRFLFGSILDTTHAVVADDTIEDDLIPLAGSLPLHLCASCVATATSMPARDLMWSPRWGKFRQTDTITVGLPLDEHERGCLYAAIRLEDLRDLCKCDSFESVGEDDDQCDVCSTINPGTRYFALIHFADEAEAALLAV